MVHAPLGAFPTDLNFKETGKALFPTTTCFLLSVIRLYFVQ